MRKTAICIGTGFVALLQCGAAQAQSDLSIYGVIDVFAEHGKAGTQAAPTKDTRLQSGAANGSRLGLRGSEDLGGGLKAIYQLEHGLLADTGNLASTGTFWNRQVFVGLSGGWGTLTAGRQYSPLLTHQDTFDTALSTTGYGSGYNSGVMRTVSRVNNSVLYKSPTLGGFTGALMVAPGEGVSGKIHSASVKFSQGMFGIGAAYLTVEALDATKEDKTIANISGSLKFGPATVMLGLQGTQNDSQNVNVVDDRSEIFFGGTYAFGAGELRASYAQGKVDSVADSTARHYSLGYLYNLSKRTALYAAVQEIDNPDNLAYRTTGFTFDAIDGGLAAGAGVKARAVAVGLRHRF